VSAGDCGVAASAETRKHPESSSSGTDKSHLDGFADLSTIRCVIKRSNPEVGYLAEDGIAVLE
jgi:hypothetical protein